MKHCAIRYIKAFLEGRESSYSSTCLGLTEVMFDLLDSHKEENG